MDSTEMARMGGKARAANMTARERSRQATAAAFAGAEIHKVKMRRVVAKVLRKVLLTTTEIKPLVDAVVDAVYAQRRDRQRRDRKRSKK